MDSDLKQSTFDYYSARAPEFDDVYTGLGPASIANREVYREEAIRLEGIVGRVCSGALLDVACGTAYWLTGYAGNCKSITLFDQSEEMLAAAMKRAGEAGAAQKVTTVRGDALELDVGDSRFDCALVAFLVSHLTDDQETRLFLRLKRVLKPGGTVLLMDSSWSLEREMVRAKEGEQERTLSDGRTFRVYKKYLDREDIAAVKKRHGLDLSIEHYGQVFFAARGCFA